MTGLKDTLAEHCRVDIALLAMLFLALLVQSLLFIFGVPCSPYPLWCSFAAVTVFIASYSRACLFRFWGLAFICALFTAYTFPCMGWDVSYYHYPMQMLLRDGWNPVYCSVIEQFDDAYGALRFGKLHTLFLPHLNALCGALAGHSLGLHSGCAFFNCVYVVVLARVSYDFAREAWSCRTLSAVCFSLCVVSQTKLTSISAGMVDYLTFASLTVSLFSAVLWHLRRRGVDLTLLVMSMVICSLSKTTGLVSCVVLGVLLLSTNWRVKRVWLSAGAVAAMILVMGAHPLLTSWYHYGCPLYPTVSWSPDAPVINLTDDFVENPDAQLMGYPSRIVYAWISPELATRCCAWFYDKPAFSPVFTFTRGYGLSFRCLLVASVVMMLCTKKNLIAGVIVVVFVLSNLCPLKYIGYPRYFPQIWLIPILSAYNFVYSEGWVRNRCPRVAFSFVKTALLAGFLVLAAFVMVRTAASYGRSLAWERIRQDELQRLRIARHSVTLPDTPLQYALYRRLKHAGVRITPNGAKAALGYSFRADSVRSDLIERNDKGEPTLFFYWQELLASDRSLEDVIKECNQRYPACESPREVLRFRWRDAFVPLPKPLGEKITF